MNVQKAKLKMLIAGDIGGQLAEKLADYKAQEHLHDGGAQMALKIAADIVNGVMKRVDDDVRAGAFDRLDGPLDVASTIKKYLQKAVVGCEESTKAAQLSKFKAQGKQLAAAEMLEIPRHMAEEEARKIESALQALEAVPDQESARPAADHEYPPPTLKQQAEDEAVAAAPAPVPVSPAKDATAPKTPRKRAPRRRKADSAKNT